jgi:hypothetical protein
MILGAMQLNIPQMIFVVFNNALNWEPIDMHVHTDINTETCMQRVFRNSSSTTSSIAKTVPSAGE